MEIYIARSGDTLQSLGRRFSVDPEALRRENALNDPARLTPGLALLIPGRASPSAVLELGAYAAGSCGGKNPGLSEALSFVCPFCAHIDEAGRLPSLDERALLALTRSGDAAPLLALSNADGQGGYSAASAHRFLTEPGAADMLLELLAPALSRGCRGLYLELLWIYPFDREPFNRLLRELSEKLHALGAYLVTALPPKDEQSGESLACAGYDYACHGEYADRCVLLACDWGNALSAPQAVAPPDRIRAALDYSAGRLPTGKLLLALSARGYNWRLPWRKGQAASPVFHSAAANMAVALGAQIRLDSGFASPYFTYADPLDLRHAVWFEDVRCTRKQLELVEQYSLAGLFFLSASHIHTPSLRLIQSRYIAEVYE